MIECFSIFQVLLALFKYLRRLPVSISLNREQQGTYSYFPTGYYSAICVLQSLSPTNHLRMTFFIRVYFYH